MPTHDCQKRPCALYVFAEPFVQVNVTVTSIIYVGDESQTCQFGGLVAGEVLSHDYKESVTLCTNLNSSLEHSRSFYSFNSSLILVLYWYEQYSEINVTLALSQTPCKPVYFDLCHFEELCDFETRWIDGQLPRSAFTCHSYLEYITQFSSLKLEAFLPKYDAYLHHRYHTMTFFSAEKSCTVLQIVREEKQYAVKEGGMSESYKMCEVNIVPALSRNQEQSIEYQIMGSFPPHLTNKHQYTALADCIQFSGLFQQFCHHESCQTSSKIMIEPQCNQGEFLYSAKLQPAAESLFCENPFTVYLSLLQQSCSWLDIIVTSTQSFDKKSSLFSTSNDTEFPRPSQVINFPESNTKSLEELQCELGHQDLVFFGNTKGTSSQSDTQTAMEQIEVKTSKDINSFSRRLLFAYDLQLFPSYIIYNEVENLVVKSKESNLMV